ncbi:MAG: 6-phosphogluconolactonase [Planctomycetota bacterium]|nr:6-phosphogluconolactonase [Planctomycetota bacterium]
MQHHPHPEVRVVDASDHAVPLLLEELRGVVSAESRPLVSFATGGTFAAFFRSLDAELKSGAIDSAGFLGTHLDEYIAFEPNRRGGMVHELTLRCPALRDMLARGAFLPVPCHGAEGSLRAHEERIERAGGIKLQFLGIGRNGHVAFNEPGASFDDGFHVTALAEMTRRDAAPTFVPDEPPRRAVTAGMASILGAERIVLCAFGKGKADAVRAMLQGDVSGDCPASALQQHPNVLVLLDPEAASNLDAAAGAAG